MTLNGVMAVIMHYFSKFRYLAGVLRKSSRSLSHVQMSSCLYMSAVAVAGSSSDNSTIRYYTSGFADDVMISHNGCHRVKSTEAIRRHTHNITSGIVVVFAIGGLPSIPRWQHRVVATGCEVCYNLILNCRLSSVEYKNNNNNQS